MIKEILRNWLLKDTDLLEYNETVIRLTDIELIKRVVDLEEAFENQHLLNQEQNTINRLTQMGFEEVVKQLSKKGKKK